MPAISKVWKVQGVTTWAVSNANGNLVDLFLWLEADLCEISNTSYNIEDSRSKKHLFVSEFLVAIAQYIYYSTITHATDIPSDFFKTQQHSRISPTHTQRGERDLRTRAQKMIQKKKIKSKIKNHDKDNNRATTVLDFTIKGLIYLAGYW